MSKGAEVDSSMSERPQHQRPRRLADWLNPTGRRRVHSLIPPSVLITRRRLRESGMRENRTYRLSGGRRPAPAGRASSDPTPLKAANKGAQTPAESPEGRASTKGNSRDQSTHRTQGRDGVLQAVERIRQGVRLFFVGGRISLCGSEAGGNWIRHGVVREQRRGPVADGTCAVSDGWGCSAGTRALGGGSQYASMRRRPVAA